MVNRTNQRINYFRYLFRDTYQSKKSPYYFGHGRTALKIGLQSLNVQNGKIVLVPNYICREAIDPFLELNIDIVYYSVNKDLSPDWNSVNELFNNQVFAIMMVHYFGIPQDIDVFLNFCNKNKLLLIEDNSHGFLGSYNNKLLGTFGDIGISSPRKSVAILNGGILYLKNDLLQHKVTFKLEGINIAKLILSDFIGRLLDKMFFIKNILLNKIKSNISEENKFTDQSIDYVSFKVIKELDIKNISNRRIKIYSIWEKWAISIGLTPLQILIPEGCAPLSIPIIFKEIEERNKWMNIFQKNQIASYKWPDLPEEISKSYNSGQNLQNTILCLPIHLSINPKKLEDYLYNNFKF